MKKSNIKKLLENMCCSVCRHDFDEDSIQIKRQENNLLVLQIICPECGKSFGLALLGTGDESIKQDKKDEPLTFQECPEPINYDDVLNGHNFIDKLEKDWTKYIPEEFK